MSLDNPECNHYVAWLITLYSVLSKIRVEGLMAIEEDVEEPENADSLFTRHPKTLGQPYLGFATDILRMMVSGILDADMLAVYAKHAIRRHREEGRADIPMFECIWLTLWASVQGMAPQIAVEFGRQAIPVGSKPDFLELESMIRNARRGGQSVERHLDAEVDRFMASLAG